MLYLTHWRMQLAASRLAAGAAPVSAVASDVGYNSELPSVVRSGR